jgi:Flp pilus assembly pilin Flp
LEDGPTTTEYAVLLGVIAVAVIGALSLFGVKMDNIYTTLNSTLQVF